MPRVGLERQELDFGQYGKVRLSGPITASTRKVTQNYRLEPFPETMQFNVSNFLSSAIDQALSEEMRQHDV